MVAFTSDYLATSLSGEGRKSATLPITVGGFQENSFTKEINAIEKQIGREINFTHYSLEEYMEEKNKNGSFLCEVLKGETIVLKRSADV